ncbi:TPA: hypothetical protein ACIJ11_004306, partial [Klebsiella aerogenes]
SRFLSGIASWTVIHLCSNLQIVKTPPRRGFYIKEVKLTDKPLSFWYSVVDSHSSLFHPPDSKNPAEAGFLH